MVSPWILVISGLVLLVAIFIKGTAHSVSEDEHVFLGLIGGFFVLYVIATLTVSWLNPGMVGHASLSSLVDLFQFDGP